MNKPNHLVNEKSPYLEQHAYNPVDWYPWGEEAFRKAREESKPIFLSIGYATCHWCHVMEKESFSNPEIAEVMNKSFISIKVDREERPDVDSIYMTAAHAAGWGGGWPLSMWLTPELKPFFGGTYFPPDERWGRPGFKQILRRIDELWKTQKNKLSSDADLVITTLRQYTQRGGQGPSGELAPLALDKGFASYQDSFISAQGGFSQAPKFPMPVNQNFLLRYYARTKDKKALDMVTHTLREMAKGGIYDCIGGGFHRYSTDANWHVPHFEKMLYDNAQLAVNYLETYQITKDKEFAEIARETLNYVLRDMTHPKGGFYCAEDADSLPMELKGKVEDRGHEHRSEGAFYIWEKSEILEILGRESGEIFSYSYGVKPEGNAETDPHGEFKGKNILYLAHPVNETARRFGKSEKSIREILETCKLKLLEKRSQRPMPQKDDKILADWNGLMISAFAKAAQILDDTKYSKAAENSARFIKTNLYDDKKNRLSRRWRNGEGKIPGLALDYALLTQGLIDLYEASLNPEWLDWAIRLTEAQIELFYDSQKGGFFMTNLAHDKNLLLREVDDTDNVIPSASSVAALNLLRLAQFTDRSDFQQAAEKTLRRFGAQMTQQPRSLPQMLSALDYALSKPKQILLAGNLNSPDTKKILREIHAQFIPNKILRFTPAPTPGKTTASVCIGTTCELPTSDLEVLREILSR